MANTKLIREKYGLTQKEFAEKYGLKKRTVENWDYRDQAQDYFIDLVEKYEELQQDHEKLLKDYSNLLNKFVSVGGDLNDEK